MRVYEIIFIIRPDLGEPEVEALVEQMRQGVTEAGGTVTKLEPWGKRKLAYHVRGYREGFYVFFEIEGMGEVVRELERRLKVAEPVVKILSVRVDLERKQAEKLRHRREHRTARRQRTGSSPSSSAEAVTGS